MGRMVRIFEGRFGRLVLTDLAAKSELRADQDPAIVLARGEGEILLLNPGESHTVRDATRALVFHGARDWLREGFPAVFAEAHGKPFGDARASMSPRIRQLAETLAVEVFNDRFLSSERLEFMLQELVLSIVETCFASRRASALWRGSRFEDL